MSALRQEARPLALFTALMSVPLSVGALLVGGPIAALFFAAAVLSGIAMIVILLIASDYL